MTTPTPRARLFGRLRWTIPALTLAAAIGLLGFLPGQRETAVRSGLTYASNDLATALEADLSSAQELGSATRILLTFQAKDGPICRGFARADRSGIACRNDHGWHLRVQRDGIDVATGDPRQARAVEAAITLAARQMAAGQAFGPEDEVAARARHWRAPRVTQ